MNRCVSKLRQVATGTSPALLIFSVAFSVTVGAQQSYHSYQQLSGQVLSKVEQNQQQARHSFDRNMSTRFQGWKHSEKLGLDYIKRFSRATDRTRRGHLLDSTAHATVRSGSSATQFTPFAPSALPGLLLRDSLPAGYIPTAVATGDFNADGKMDFVVANGLMNWRKLLRGQSRHEHGLS
jgi:hypothetical protein